MDALAADAQLTGDIGQGGATPNPLSDVLIAMSALSLRGRCVVEPFNFIDGSASALVRRLIRGVHWRHPVGRLIGRMMSSGSAHQPRQDRHW
jgi:hypothetical protein